MHAAQRIHFKSLTQTFALILAILLIKLNCVQQNKHDMINAGNANFLRFQNLKQAFPNETIMPDLTTINGYKNQQFRYKLNEMSPKREGRGFHFQATDEDLIVETEFIIPFVKIPIVWATNFMRTSMRKLLNLNTGALLWSGAFVVVGAIIAGVVNMLTALKPALATGLYGWHPSRKIRGLMDKEDFWQKDARLHEEKPLNLAELLDAKLYEHNINLKSCVQRSICHYIKYSAAELGSGTASNTKKIFLSVLRAQQIRQFLRGTAVLSAIEDGQNQNCEILEHRCELPKFGKFSFI